MNPIIVQKGRTILVSANLGMDVSQDTFKSQIRKEKSSSSPLIAEWEVLFDTDGTDGELVLRLDDAVTAVIEEVSGYMDIKRTTSGEPMAVFDDMLEVLFVDSITA